MKIISRVDNNHTLSMFKKMIEIRRGDNYMFMPKWFISKHLEDVDCIPLMKTLLESDWGTWLPEPGELLIHKSDIRCEEHGREIVMTLSIDGVKIVYLKHFDVKLRKNIFYIATNAYHNVVKSDIELYNNLIEPIYNITNDNSEWKTSIKH